MDPSTESVNDPHQSDNDTSPAPESPASPAPDASGESTTAAETPAPPADDAATDAAPDVEPDAEQVPAGAEPPAEDPAPVAAKAEPAAESEPAEAEAETEAASDGTAVAEAEVAAAAEEPAGEEPAAEEPAAEEPAGEEAAAMATDAHAPTDHDAPPGKSKRKGKGRKDGETPPAEAENAAEKVEKKPKKPAGPDPAEVTRKIGSTNEAALRYVASPDPQLARLSRKVREELITEIPPVTAGALLGPEALARHFIASAASGRYRDLFSLWDLFRSHPDAVKPVLAERQRALERGRQALATAAKLGLGGHADRVAEDIARAEGLIWQWLREVLVENLEAVGRRPAVAAALALRDPSLTAPLPDEPTDQWLAEAAALKQTAEGAPPAIDALLSAHISRLPATVATLSLVADSFPDRVPQLIDRVDLASPEIGAILAWARDHGVGDRLRARIATDVSGAAERSRAEGLSAWQTWNDRGVAVEMPESLRAPTLEGLDLTRPESASLIATLVGQGAQIQPQAVLDDLAGQNRQAAEKAYEAFVCAELDVHLPLVLEGNPIVKEGTRCPACQAWTWVRPGHERRCPRLLADLQAQAAAASTTEPPVAAAAGEQPAAAEAPASDST